MKNTTVYQKGGISSIETHKDTLNYETSNNGRN